MKKIAIVTRRMIIGGIEKSLISLLEAIPENDYEVTVFLMGRDGELESEIPDWVKVKSIFGDESSTLKKIKNNIKYGNIRETLKLIYYTLKARNSKNVYKEELCYSKMLPILKEEYDLAIAYHTPSSFPVVYVMNNIKSKYKFAWIHSDVSVYKEELVPYKEFYYKYDKIYCVSKYGRDKFIGMYPELKDKTEVFYNIISKDKLENMAEQGSGFEDDFEGIRILTVGRLTDQKGQDIIPDIVKLCINDGLNIRWYCIGDGENKDILEEKIKDNKLESRIILLGNKLNPYPYFKECDIYVQPSRHEGYCITLAEARMFSKPIVTTDFVGAMEQIVDGETGLIVKFDKYEIYNAIKKLSIDNTLVNNIIHKLKNKN